jgi:hypothetical protein
MVCPCENSIDFIILAEENTKEIKIAFLILRPDCLCVIFL